MTTRSSRNTTALFAVLALAASGCQGEPGPQGPQGPKGDPGVASPCTIASSGGSSTITCGSTSIVVTNGTDGLDGTSCQLVTYYDGSANVECTDGTFVTVLEGGKALEWDAPLPGVIVSVVAVEKTVGTGNFGAGDTVKVTFKVEDATNHAIPLAYLERARIWLSGPTTGYQHILPAGSAAYDMLKSPQAVENDDGTMTYTFADPMPATVPAQLGSATPASFPDGSLAGSPLPSGTYTVSVVARRAFNIDGRTVRDVGFAQQNVLVGTADTLETHEVVTDAACNKCHRTVQGHGGGYRSTKLCVTCHTAGGETKSATGTPVPIEFAVMLHKIHDGSHLPSVNGVGVDASGNRTYGTGTPFTIGNNDFSGINFPAFPSFNISRPRNAGYSALSPTNKTKETALLRGVTNCGVCHSGAAQGALALETPSRRVCGSCHDDIVWTQPYTHNWSGSGVSKPGAGQMPEQASDEYCKGCHASATTNANHLHPLQNPAVNPELVMAVSKVTGGTGTNGNFTAGDKVSVSFGITDGAGNSLPASALDSVTMILTGPNQNRNAIFPQASASGVSVAPFDAAGRLVALSTTGKGAMSKVVEGGVTASAALKVQFTSSTAFDVSDAAGNLLGNGTLPAAKAVSVPSGASIGSVVLASGVGAQNLRVTFPTTTTFNVESDLGGSFASIGGGTLPAATSSSVFFVSNDGTIQFLVTIGSTAVTAGTTTFYVSVFKGTVNEVLFAIIPGATAFAANDRFYYDYLAPAASYTLSVPMDIPWETLGYGNDAAGQTFTAANLPVYFGRQTVYQASALGSAVAVNSLVKAFDRFAYLSDVSGLAPNDFLVFEPGTTPGAAGASEEYLRVSAVDPTVRKVTFTTVFRYAHNPGAVVKKVTTATLLLEGVDYTLTAATGAIAPTGTIASTAALFMTYRTDGAFGWKRKGGDTVQAVYGPALNYTGAFGEPWGVWAGKPYIDGTYAFSMWGYRNLYFGEQGEAQTYRGTSRSAEKNILYGAASTEQPYALIESRAVCNNCHVDLSFHGGSRRGGETCLNCHSLSGMEDGKGKTYMFRNFLHEAHVEALPSMPNGAQHCDTCHGTAATWQQPTDHTYPNGQPTWNYAEACSGCHDVISTAGGAHIDSMISQFTQVESCAVCHGPGTELEPARMHPSR